MISGTALDNVAVSAVEVGLRRKLDGKWWDGSAWSYSPAPVRGAASYTMPLWVFTAGPSSSSLSAGAFYEIYLWARDGAGNEGTAPAPAATVTISSSAEAGDRTPPSSAILYPVSGAVLSSLGTLSGTAGDDVSVAKVEVGLQEASSGRLWTGAGWSYGGTLLNAAPLSNGYWSYAGPAAAYLTSGSSYTAYARAVDGAGNMQLPPAQSSFTYQSAAPPAVSSPTAKITVPARGAQVSSLAQISGTVSGDAGEVRVRIQHPASGRWWKGATQEWSSVSVENYAAFGTGYWSFNAGPKAEALVAGSSYTVLAYARNGAGTLTQVPADMAVVFTSSVSAGPVDTVPPMAAILSPPPGMQTLVSLGSISGTAADNAGVSQVYVGVRRRTDDAWWGESYGWAPSQTSNAASVDKPGSPMTSWSYGALPESYLAVGSSYTVFVWAKDSANNISATPAERTFTFGTVVVVDTTPPSAVTDLTARSTSSAAVELTWKAPGGDGSIGSAELYHIHFSTLGPLTLGNFFGEPTRRSDDQFAMSQAGVFDAALGPVYAAVPKPKASGLAESLLVYGLEPGKQYFFSLRAADRSGNLSPYFNSAQVRIPLPAAQGDGSGWASWSPSTVTACSVVQATVTFTSSRAFSAGGLIAIQLPDSYPQAQASCSSCPAYVRVQSTSSAVLEALVLPELGPRWVGALVASGRLEAGEEVLLVFDRLPSW
ncbi:MAG: fibronectin type III domain-containing protein, partial [Elusimicrobiota bacterium]